MSVTSGVPFGPDDSNLGVAYVSAFILVFFVSTLISDCVSLSPVNFPDHPVPYGWPSPHRKRLRGT